jgi:cytochrome b
MRILTHVREQFVLAHNPQGALMVNAGLVRLGSILREKKTQAKRP